MNLKKIIVLLFFVPVLTLAGCEDEPIDDVLVNKIWQEAIVLTQIPAGTPIPEIKFMDECPDIDKCLEKNYEPENIDNCPIKAGDILGVYYYADSTIRICRNNIYENNWDYDRYFTHHHLNLSYKGKIAMFYGTVAHEMLHHALYLKGRSGDNEHQIMKDEKLLEKELNLIAEYYKLPKDGIQKRSALESLDRGIRLDKEKSKKNQERKMQLNKIKNRWLECR